MSVNLAALQQNSQEQQKKDDDKWLIAWILLLLLLGAKAVRGLTPAQQRRTRMLLRDKFNGDVARLAAAITSGAITLDVWQTSLATASGDYARSMAVAGAGKLPSAAVQDSVETSLAAQEPFLSGFAEAIAVGGLSVAQITARSVLYGAAGWAAHWMATESVQQDYTVVFYEARDDRRTCGPCLDAERGGPYRVGRAPLPGSICRGGGYCRCNLRYVVDRAVWESLA